MRRLIVPSLVFAGLVAGFSREIVLAYFFGVSNDVEIFRVAFGLPSIFSDGLAVSFAAILLRSLLMGERKKPAQALHTTVWSTVAFGGGVFVAGILSMPWQAQLLAPGMDASEQALVIAAGRICWLMFLLVVLSFPLRALLSARGRIWPGASSQFMRSGGFVAALLTMIVLLGWRDLMAPAIAAALGGAIVLIVHIAALGRRDLRRDLRRIAASLSVPPRIAALSPTLGAFGLVLISQLFLSSGRILDRAVSTGMSEGMLAALEYSYALLMALAAILATSANLAIAPRMGRAIRDTGGLSREQIVYIAVLAIAATTIGVVLSFGAEPLISIVFQRGAFDVAAKNITSGVFRLHVLGLGPLVLSLLLMQVLLLHGRQRVVFSVAALKMSFKFVALWWVMGPNYDILDIARTLIWTELATSVCLIIILGHFLLQKNMKNKISK